MFLACYKAHPKALKRRLHPFYVKCKSVASVSLCHVRLASQLQNDAANGQRASALQLWEVIIVCGISGQHL